MSYKNFAFKITYNHDYYIKRSIERLGQMRQTYDTYLATNSHNKHDIVDHSSFTNFDLQDLEQFNPVMSKNRLPYVDLRANYMHLQPHSTLNVTKTKLEDMDYVLVKWPDDK